LCTDIEVELSLFSDILVFTSKSFSKILIVSSIYSLSFVPNVKWTEDKSLLIYPFC